MFRLLIPALVAILSSIAVPLVKKVLVALGFGYLTYSGANALLDAAFNAVKGNISGLPLDIIIVFAYFDIDKMITLLISAYTVRATLNTYKLTTVKVG